MITNTNQSIVQPYLDFNGRCEEAVEFYRKAVGAEVLMLAKFKDAPPECQCAPGSLDKVMHSTLRIGESIVMASDGRCTGATKFEGISLSLTVPTVADAERAFKALGEGGQVFVPLSKTFFAERFGIVNDRFGVSWMLLTGPTDNKSK